MSNAQIESLLKKGVARIIDEDHLRERLLRGEKLKIKLGIDPSGTVIHLGHMVPILKLRQFQELGHEVTIIIGDATGMIGDASDKDSERPMLMREQTRANGQEFLKKFARVLDLDKVKVVYNSDWLDKVNFAGVGELAKNFSVAEMLDRDNFSKRYKAGVRISLQEFLYPLMQGYDSVALRTDVELGGTEQYFNLLAGRRLQEACGQEKQDIMMFDLLVGSDGKKMSKTSPNSVAIDEAPQSMYQKLISIKDELIVPYFELTTDATLEEVAMIRKRLESGEHPNKLKEELAQRIITMYHGKPYKIGDSSNIEIYNISYIEPANILINNNIISKDEILKMNNPVETDDFIKIISNISGINNLDDLKTIKNKFNNKGGINTEDALIEVLKALGESPSANKKSKPAWIQRAKDIGVVLKGGLETTILLKELTEMIVSLAGLDSFEQKKHQSIVIGDLLKYIGFCATSGDVRNALAGKSVRVNSEVIEDPKYLVTISPEGTLIEMGKKKAKRVTL